MKAMPAIFILNKQQEVLAILSNTGDKVKYSYNMLHQTLKGSSYTLRVPSTEPESEHLIVGNFIAFQNKEGEAELFRILDSETTKNDVSEIEAYAENVGLELIGSVLRPYDGQEVEVDLHLQNMLQGTGWQVGNCDPTANLAFKTTKHIPLKEALTELAELFEGDLHFYVEMTGSKVSGRFVAFRQKLGEDNGKRFVYGKDIKGVKRIETAVKKNDFDGVFTAIIPEGIIDDNGDAINIKNETFSIANGDPFDKPAGQDFVEDVDASDIWGVDGRRIEVHRIYDTNNPKNLGYLAWRDIQNNKNSRVYYDFDLALLENIPGYEHEEVNKGDVIRLIDTTFNPPLQLEARVVELFESDTNPDENKAIVGDYDGKPVNLLKQFKELSDKVKQKEKNWDAGGSGVSPEQVIEIIEGNSIAIPGTRIDEGLYSFPIELATQSPNILSHWRGMNLPYIGGTYRTSSGSNSSGEVQNYRDEDGEQVISIEYLPTSTTYEQKTISIPVIDGRKFCYGSFYLIRFKARNLSGNGYPLASISGADTSSSRMFRDANGLSNFIPDNQIFDYDQRQGAGEFNQLDIGSDWVDSSFVLSPTYAKFERGYGGENPSNSDRQLNSFIFANTNLRSKRDYLLQFEDKDVAINSYDENPYDSRYRTAIKIGVKMTPVNSSQSTSYLGTQCIMQFKDFEMYEINTEILEKFVYYSPDQNMYIQTDLDEFRFTSPGVQSGNFEYKDIRVRNVLTGSSITIKDHLRKLEENYDARGMIMELDPFLYKFKDDIVRGIYDKDKAGFILEMLNPIFRDGKGVDTYALLTFTVSALKDEIKRGLEKDKQISELYEMVSILQQQFDELKE